MKNVPEKIYLNIGAKGMADDFKKLCEVTWCKDKIHEDDIEYTITTAPIDSKEGAEVVLLEALEDIAESKYPESVFTPITDKQFAQLKLVLVENEMSIDALSGHYGRVFQRIFQDRAKEAIQKFKKQTPKQ